MKLLAASRHGAHVADYIADLATTEGLVALREREAGKNDIGRSLREICEGLAVRLHRGGMIYSPWDPAAERIEQGDLILEIIPTKQTARTA